MKLTLYDALELRLKVVCIIVRFDVSDIVGLVVGGIVENVIELDFGIDVI